MAKVSASTLVRRAAKEKNPKKAKALRARAAKMRSDARKTKKEDWIDTNIAKARLNPNRTIKSIAREAYQSGQAVGVEAKDTAFVTPPIIDPAEIERLRGLAKKKVNTAFDGDGDKYTFDGFGINLRLALVNARVDGERKAEAAGVERMHTQIEAQHINVVCAFLAEMSGIAALNRGPMPRAVMVSGYTVARILDALRKAGYTEDGKEGMKRPL